MSIRATDRLLLPTEEPSVNLRELRPDDAEVFFDAFHASIEELSQFEPSTRDDFPSKRAVQEWILGREGLRREYEIGIWSQDNFVGVTNLQTDRQEKDVAEVGYWLDSRHTGKGYATLGLKALTAYFADQYYVFVGKVRVGNTASMRVLERAGFERTNAFRKGNIDYQNFDLYPNGKDEA